MADPLLSVEGLRVRYGKAEQAALEGLDLSISDGELVCVLGPSGSGKTTLLRAIAGLETPAAGRIVLEGRDLADVPTHERHVGLMFQDYALFPHLDVTGNVGFGLRMSSWQPDVARNRVTELLATMSLTPLASRPVGRLSGGEQQRVALARALAPEPRLLMLDEPLGSLDRALREQLPLELRRLFRELGSTVLYVTHDQDEALTMAERVVVLDAGRLVADGTPETLWARPTSAWLARFLGYRNVAEGRLHGRVADTPWGRLALDPAALEGFEGPPGGRMWVVLRSEALGIGDRGPIGGSIVSRRFQGDHVRIVVSVDAVPGWAPATLEVAARGGRLPVIGERVRIEPGPGALILVADATL